MLSEPFRELTRAMARVQRIVWCGFSGAILIYVGVIYMEFGIFAAGSRAQRSNPLFVPLAVLAVVNAIASLWITDVLLPKRRLRAILDRQPDPEALARVYPGAPLDPERLARIKSLPLDEQRLLALVPAVYIAFIVRLAFGNAIALYGLVLSQFSRSLVPMLPFAIVALVFNLRVSPDLESRLERAVARAAK